MQNGRKRGSDKKSLELVHRDFYGGFSLGACFCISKLILLRKYYD